jgi:hypothetical protein
MPATIGFQGVFNMGTIVVSGLISKRAELAGQIEAAQQNILAWQGALKHLDATIKLFAPETDLRRIKATKQRKRNAFFAHGELNRAVLEALRDASEPLTSHTIAERLIAARSLKVEGAQFELLRNGITAVLQRLSTSKQAQSVGRDGRAQLWQRPAS